MKPDLEPAKNVLRSFLSEIELNKEFQRNISAPVLAPFNIADRTPDLSKIEFGQESDTFLQKENAYIWLFAEAKHFRALIHRPKLPQVPEYYRQTALPIYQQWHSSEKEIFCRVR